MDCLPGRVADAQLKRPSLCPIFFLLILTDFNQDCVAAGQQDASTHILIHFRSRVINPVLMHKPPVQPDLGGVVTAQPELRVLAAVRPKLGEGVAGNAVFSANRFIQIDDAELIRRLVVDPADFARSAVVGLARILAREVDPLFRRIHNVEASLVGVVEGADQFPIANKSEVLREIDFFAQLFKLGLDGPHLIEIARSRQRLLIDGPQVSLACDPVALLSRRVEQARDRFPPKLGAAVVQKAGHERLGRFMVSLP